MTIARSEAARSVSDPHRQPDAIATLRLPSEEAA